MTLRKAHQLRAVSAISLVQRTLLLLAVVYIIHCGSICPEKAGTGSAVTAPALALL
mgnify:FL=1